MFNSLHINVDSVEFEYVTKGNLEVINVARPDGVSYSQWEGFWSNIDQNGVDTYEEEIVSLQDKIETLEDTVDELRKELDAKDYEISGLEKEIERLESEIEDIHRQLDGDV